MTRRSLFRPVAFAIAAVLAGCGGGSTTTASSSTTTTAAVTVPLQTATTNLVKQGYSASVAISGWYGSTSTTASGSATVSQLASTTTTLAGVNVLANTQLISGTLGASNGTTVALSSQTTLYENLTTYTTVATSSSSEYVVYPSYALPSTVVAGDTGVLGTATAYADSTQATLTGTIALSYSVQTDTSSTLLVTFTNVYYDALGNNTGSQQTTYRLDESGDISFVSMQITVVANSVTTGYSITLE